MKSLLLITLGLSLFFHSFSQFQNTIFSIPANKSEIIKTNKIVKEVIYNYKLKNNIPKDSVLFATYIYDTLGNIIEETIEKTKMNGKTIRKYTYSYNSTGQLTKQRVDMPGYRMTTIYEYDYDSAGNEITKYDYNEDTTRLTIYQKKYNPNNLVTELIIKINNSDHYVSKQYVYNADNELSKEIAFNPQGQVIYTYFYEYDKSLNKKIVYLENQQGKKRIEEFIYNNEKQITKAYSVFETPTFNSRESTEYESLNQVTENFYNPDNTVFETAIYINGKKVQLNKHYYFKQ